MQQLLHMRNMDTILACRFARQWLNTSDFPDSAVCVPKDHTLMPTCIKHLHFLPGVILTPLFIA